MVDTATSLEQKLQPERVNRFNGDDNIAFTDQAAAADRVQPLRPSPWPFKVENTSPFTWWRQLPSDAFCHVDHSLLVATLESTSVLRGNRDLAAAMRGDTGAAVGTALELMPIEKITLPVDITMTALMRTALDGDAASSLVMAQIVGLVDLGHEFSAELAASWLVHGERHSRERDKFREASITVLRAFKDHRNQGEEA